MIVFTLTFRPGGAALPLHFWRSGTGLNVVAGVAPARPLPAEAPPDWHWLQTNDNKKRHRPLKDDDA
jgi:hypothetical protein